MVTLQVSIAGSPLPQALAGQLTKLTYKEGLKWTGDTINFDIADPDGLFRRTFRIKAALPVTLSISGGGGQRDAGTFYIHSLAFKGNKSSGGSIHIDCTSIPVKSDDASRNERKSKGLEKTTLKKMASQYAQANGMTLQWQCDKDPKIGRTDQHDQSDLVQIAKHCDEENYLLKIRKGSMWIIDRAHLESQGPVGTIVFPTSKNPGGINGVGGMEDWSINESTEDIHKGAEVAWKDHKTGKVVRGMVMDPHCSDIGTILRLKDNPHLPDDEEITLPAVPKIPSVQNIPQQLKGLQLPDSAIKDSLFQVCPLKSGTSKAPAPSDMEDPDQNKITRAKHVAAKKLKKKNDKRHGVSITLPYELGANVESGTVYTLQNSTPDTDGPWLVVDVTHDFSKGGHKTKIEFEKVAPSAAP
jgi:hypothetical protein